MKKITTLLFILVAAFHFNTFAQTMPPCGTNDAPGNTCLIATPICNLDGYCGTTNASYTVNTWTSSCGVLGLFDCGLTGEFCGSIENNSFLSFVADGSSISFDVWVYNSLYTYGIQIMIFQPQGNCSGDVTTYYCNGQMSPSPNAQTVSATGLVPGQTYYIMIDGNAGDVCDYTFAANTGIATPVEIDLGASTTICQGESVTVTASGGNGVYSWDASPDLNTTTGATVTITPPTTVGTYTYTVHSTGGTTLCPQGDQASIQVIVENCGCTVTSTVSTSQFCEGSVGTVNLTAETLPNTTYSWSDGTNTIGSTQNLSNIVVPSAPGTYTYTVTATDNLGSVCSGSSTVTVNPLPNVNAGNDQILTCTTTSVTLAGSSTTSGVNYSWTGPGITAGGTTASATANQAGTYILTVTNPTTNCQLTDTVVVTSNTTPPSASITGIQLIVPCQANQTTLTASSSTSGVSYSWTGSGIVSGGSTNQVVVNQAGTYTVVVTNPTNGCTGTANVNVTLHNPFLPTIFSDTSMCATSFQIPLSSVNSDGGGFWKEANNLGSFSPNNGVQAPTFTPVAGTTSYTLIYTDSICGNTTSANVIIAPLPTVVQPPAYSCNDMSEILVTSSYSGGTWTVIDNPSTPMLEDTALVIESGNPTGGGYVQSNTFVSAHPNHGTYTMSFTDNFCNYTQTVTLNFIQYPWTEVSDTTLCIGAEHLLTAAENSYTTNYEWNNGSTGPSIVVTETGVYTVKASNECYYYLDSALVQFNVCDIEVPNVISLSSQAGNQTWYVTAKGVTEFECLILNRWGNVVSVLTDVNQHWDGKDKSGNFVSEGVYFYKINATIVGGEEITKHGFVQVVK